MKNVSTTILIWLIIITFANGQTNDEIQKIEDFILQSMHENKVVGSAFTIFSAEEDLLTRGYGKIFKGGPDVDVNTPFEIASLTKSFTALAVLQLVMEKKIKVEDPVINYLPEFKTINKDFSDKITILNLLNHNSGFTTVQGNRKLFFYENDPNSLDREVSDYKNVELKFKPGEHFEYSNANYQILGLIIEKITSQSYEQYITQNILEPLDMNFSGFIPDENTATPHRYIFEYPRPYFKHWSKRIGAAGGIFSSIGDMQKYLKAFLERDTLLLPKKGYQLIFDDNQPGLDNFGFAGWRRTIFKDNEKEIEVFWHRGISIGLLSNMFIIPSKEMAYAAFANTNSLFGIHSSLPMCFVPVNMLLNIPPQAQSPIIGIIAALLWLIPLAILISIIIRLRKQSRAKSYLRVTIITILFGGLLFLLLKVIPNQLGVNDLKTVIVFEPQVGYFLLVTSIMLVIKLILDYINLFRKNFYLKEIN